MGDPLGNAGLRVYLTGSHRDARLIAIGNDFLQAQLAAVAEDGNKSNKHRHLPRCGIKPWDFFAFCRADRLQKN
jgi:hypothetical protein